MKKILLTGFQSTVSETSIQAWLARYGPIVQIQVIRDGNAAAPVAIVAMDIGDGEAFFIVSRINNYWHDGSLINACLLLH